MDRRWTQKKNSDFYKKNVCANGTSLIQPGPESAKARYVAGSGFIKTTTEI
jgi:hypothetical protein